MILSVIVAVASVVWIIQIRQTGIIVVVDGLDDYTRRFVLQGVVHLRRIEVQLIRLLVMIAGVVRVHRGRRRTTVGMVITCRFDRVHWRQAIVRGILLFGTGQLMLA